MNWNNLFKVNVKLSLKTKFKPPFKKYPQFRWKKGESSLKINQNKDY